MGTRSAFGLILVFLILLVLASCGLFDTGASYSVTADQEGGSFAIGRNVTLEIPPGALGKAVELSFAALHRQDIEPLTPEGIQLVAAFEGQPEGLAFTKPVTVTVENFRLAPGTVPLVRLLGQQGSSAPLVNSGISYGPEAEILTFTLDHFSIYGVEAGERVAKLECQETPCRCGRIDIQQSDSDAICSQDNCHYLESEVKVQFLDCENQPVESSYLKELSPGCTPRLNLEPEQQKVVPKGQTEVTAIALISCVPIPEQTVDFSIRGHGSVDPTFQMTDSKGKANTTFQVVEEEGIAEITATASGNLNRYEVRVDGESSQGRWESFSLSKTVEIEIIQKKGLFEGSFSGCNSVVCLTDYHIKVEFSVDDLDVDGGWWKGDAVITQSGNLTLNEETADYLTITDLRMPAEIHDRLIGKYDQESGLLELRLYLFDDYLFQWEMMQVDCVEFGDLYQTEGWSLGPTPSLNPDGTAGSFYFKLDGSDTPQEGEAIYLLFGRFPDIPGAFRLSYK